MQLSVWDIFSVAGNGDALGTLSDQDKTFSNIKAQWLSKWETLVVPRAAYRHVSPLYYMDSA